jgi:hypothetical protein
MPPQDFLKFLSNPKDATLLTPAKKMSFYYSDEILNYENKSHRYSKDSTADDSQRNSTAHKITDLNITKLIEDIEYEELKK